jgi:hypothetical protein
MAALKLPNGSEKIVSLALFHSIYPEISDGSPEICLSAAMCGNVGLFRAL